MSVKVLNGDYKYTSEFIEGPWQSLKGKIPILKKKDFGCKRLIDM